MSLSILKHIPEKVINENKLQEWLEANLNVMLVGLRGTGKSQMTMEIFTKNYDTRWAYFNGATCDPWTDLIGIPTAEIDVKTGLKVIKYVKPAELSDDIEAIYVDELNRGRTATRNALLELIQFKSINGRKFPNLKVVWSSINPPASSEDENNTSDYDVEELDPAILDRFHIIVKMPSEPSSWYFTKLYKTMGTNLVEWWGQQPKEAQALISPRRLEYVAQHYKRGGDITDMLPKCANVKLLLKKINGTPTSNKYYELSEEKNPTGATIEELYNLINTENSFEEIKDIIVKDKSWDMIDLIENEEKIDIIYKNHASKIEKYFFDNFTEKGGNLYNFMVKKIGNTDKFKQRLGNSITVIPIDVTKYKVFTDKSLTNSNLKDSDVDFVNSINAYLGVSDTCTTVDRRNHCTNIITMFPKNINSSNFDLYIKFVNTLVRKTQLSNRTNSNHLDGQYCEAFVNLAVEGCKLKGLDYKNYSFYEDMIGAKQDYFVTGPEKLVM